MLRCFGGTPIGPLRFNFSDVLKRSSLIEISFDLTISTVLMKYFKVVIILLTLAVQPLSAAEKSQLFTVDMTRLLRSSEFGKNIIAANNIARKKLQAENEELEEKLLLEEKQLIELRKTLSIENFAQKR